MLTNMEVNFKKIKINQLKKEARILHLSKLSIKFESGLKISSDMQRLRTFDSTHSSLRSYLKVYSSKTRREKIKKNYT